MSRYIWQDSAWPRFTWRACQNCMLNANQRRMLNALLDGFDGNLTSSKWAKMCKVSQDTAGREIDALVRAGILAREGQGRSTHDCIPNQSDIYLEHGR